MKILHCSRRNLRKVNSLTCLFRNIVSKLNRKTNEKTQHRFLFQQTTNSTKKTQDLVWLKMINQTCKSYPFNLKLPLWKRLKIMANKNLIFQIWAGNRLLIQSNDWQKKLSVNKSNINNWKPKMLTSIALQVISMLLVLKKLLLCMVLTLIQKK